MNLKRELQGTLAVVLGGLMAASPAHALVSLNDGRDKINVGLSVSMAADSNIFANSDQEGDMVYSSSLSAEYTRRAGWIGVNLNGSVGSSRFAKFSRENFNNPSLGLELTKQSGRTTGSVTVSAGRESRADPSVNLRSDSWHFVYGLNFKYPIVSTYTMSGSFSYNERKYANEGIFANLQTFSGSLDLYHTLSNDRDMILGYRYRYSDTSRNTASIDHGLSVGLNGRLIAGITGSLRGGYQQRSSIGANARPTTSSWSASGSTTYAINKRISINGTLAKDFATTSTDAWVDTTTASADTAYVFNSHWSVSTAIAWGRTVFLGDSGRLVIALGPPLVLGPERVDTSLSWSANLNYSLSEHLKAALAYAWFRNWSNAASADFVRSSWTLTLSTRW